MGHSEIVMRLSTWQIIQFNILSYVLSAAEEAAGVGQCREVCFACRLASLVLGAGCWVGSVVSSGCRGSRAEDTANNFSNNSNNNSNKARLSTMKLL